MITRAFYTREEVCAQLGVSTRTLDRWIRDGLIDYRRAGVSTNSRLLFTQQNVDDFLDASTQRVRQPKRRATS